MFRKPVWALATVLSAGLLGLPVASHAVTTSQTFIQTSDDSSNGSVGINANNTITVTDKGGGVLDISVNLVSGWGLVNTGAGGSGGSFAFGLAGISSLTFGAVNPAAFGPTATGQTWQPVGSGTLASAVTTSLVSAAALSAPAKYSFSSGYGMKYNSSGGSHPFTGLDFTISSAGLTLATFLADLQSSNGSYFYLDVISAAGATGVVDFGLSSVPLPSAALLFGTALVGLGVLGSRRRKAKVVQA